MDMQDSITFSGGCIFQKRISPRGPGNLIIYNTTAYMPNISNINQNINTHSNSSKAYTNWGSLSVPRGISAQHVGPLLVSVARSEPFRMQHIDGGRRRVQCDLRPASCAAELCLRHHIHIVSRGFFSGRDTACVWEILRHLYGCAL